MHNRCVSPLGGLLLVVVIALMLVGFATLVEWVIQWIDLILLTSAWCLSDGRDYRLS